MLGPPPERASGASSREPAFMDVESAREHVGTVWDTSIVPAISEYIKIPNKSPLYDANWKANGHMARAVKLIETWCRARAVEGMTLEVIELDGRTPVILMEIPGTLG